MLPEDCGVGLNENRKEQSSSPNLNSGYPTLMEIPLREREQGDDIPAMP